MKKHPAGLSELILECLGALAYVAVFFLVLFSCTPAKTVLDAGVAAVVDATCKEIEGNQGLPPDVVAVTCNAAGEAGVALVNVILPRQAWEGIKARSLDAGGK